ncbi:MAG: hypothetical protein RLZZ241_2569 [Bacteroidota bacterium]|jgi:outer membrane receptor protein involved in Fe transport
MFWVSLSWSQAKIKGRVIEMNSTQALIPLNDVHVYWLNTDVGTTTDSTGTFLIPRIQESKNLVFSHIGYETDTILANRPDLGSIPLKPNNQLDEVILEDAIDPIQRSLFKVQNVVTVDSGEMLKAACCNLSESFETNPTVDVHISDALSGAKQIQMLGLNSPYLFFTQENMPSIRGASQIYGLSFIPGSWIESIQITKGSGNVVNGYESISGHINTELVKPLTDIPFFLNAYANSYDRFEFNSRANLLLDKNLGTGIYVHSNIRTGRWDTNNDQFLDTPLASQFNIMNRWQYLDAENGWVGYLNAQYLSDIKKSGAINYNFKEKDNTSGLWGSTINTSRIDLSGKIGYVFPDLPYQSFGFQGAYVAHNQNSFFGIRNYNVQQESFYTNALFNSIIGSTQHTFKTGLSFNLDQFNERVAAQMYERRDVAAGVFYEYTYDNLERLSLVAGMRFDLHNNLGNFLTPRFHLRYALWDKASFRMSVGRGKRAANIFMENQQLFASSRGINILSSGGAIYSLNPEIAWNYGVSFLQKLYLSNRTMEFSVDFYQTDFQDQVIADWESPTTISFYNLEGRSFSKTFQTDLSLEVLRDLNVRLAYKTYNVRMDYRDKNRSKPLLPNYRFFTNLSYETPDRRDGKSWRFDLTHNIIGKQRLPETTSNPVAYQLPDQAPGYAILNGQITYAANKNFEAYLGGENLSNTIQVNPLLAAEDPFGPYFDSTLSYAPVLGAVYYLGFRYKFHKIRTWLD